MTAFLLQRFAQSAVLLLVVSLIAFGVLHFAPGGPLSQFAANPDMSQADLQRMAHQMGLDRSLPEQYLEWLGNMAVGNWGRSYRDAVPVLTAIGGRLGPTIELGASAMLLAVVVGTWIGVISAIRMYSWIDYLVTALAMVAISLPVFWLGLVMIYTFSIRLGWLPVGGVSAIGDGSLLDHVHHLIAPCIVLAVALVATWSRYTRAALLEVINQDYIRTARAKGAPERRILFRHALRNAALPMIPIAGVQLPLLLSGAVVTETVFTWPGMGRLFIDSLDNRDYPVVMGVLILSAVMVLACNLLADIVYAACDPRLRLG